MNDDDIAGHRDLRGMPYRPERIIRPTLGGIRTFGRNMVLHYNLPFHHSSAPPCADRKFRERHATFTGFTAQIIQHEIDHFEGIII